ncbi:MAG: CoB--CoM heterodisulfide reductase iron-sulfur subunit B family protein [Candidatus Omnitrophota bacterium]
MAKMKLAYYPGCTLHGSAREYDVSTRAVCKELGIELEEVPDWNCCGATSAHSLDSELALLLPARNLKIIEEQELNVIIPCAACFSRTKAAAYALENDDAMRSKIEADLSYKFKQKTKIYHLVELLVEEIGIDEIKKHVKNYLDGLSAVCYYGCLLVRPHEVTQLDEKENPQLLDKLMSAIGITTVDWPYKTECCGAALSLSRGKLVTKLVSSMIRWAEEAEVDAAITACPLCQANLEMRQGEGQNFPVFYFTELLGLAFGIKEVEDSIKKHIVSVEELVRDFIKT